MGEPATVVTSVPGPQMSHQRASKAGTEQPPREDCGLAPRRMEASESPRFSPGRSASSPACILGRSPQPRLGVYGLLRLVVGRLGRLLPPTAEAPPSPPPCLPRRPIGPPLLLSTTAVPSSNGCRRRPGGSAGRSVTMATCNPSVLLGQEDGCSEEGLPGPVTGLSGAGPAFTAAGRRFLHGAKRPLAAGSRSYAPYEGERL